MTVRKTRVEMIWAVEKWQRVRRKADEARTARK
jgi:hypothetical protein